MTEPTSASQYSKIRPFLGRRLRYVLDNASPAEFREALSALGAELNKRQNSLDEGSSPELDSTKQTVGGGELERQFQFILENSSVDELTVVVIEIQKALPALRYRRGLSGQPAVATSREANTSTPVSQSNSRESRSFREVLDSGTDEEVRAQIAQLGKRVGYSEERIEKDTQKVLVERAKEHRETLGGKSPLEQWESLKEQAMSRFGEEKFSEVATLLNEGIRILDEWNSSWRPDVDGSAYPYFQAAGDSRRLAVNVSTHMWARDPKSLSEASWNESVNRIAASDEMYQAARSFNEEPWFVASATSVLLSLARANLHLWGHLLSGGKQHLHAAREFLNSVDDFQAEVPPEFRLMTADCFPATLDSRLAYATLRKNRNGARSLQRELGEWKESLRTSYSKIGFSKPPVSIVATRLGPTLR